MKAYQAKELSVREQSAAQYDSWYVASKGASFDVIEKDLYVRSVLHYQKPSILDIGAGTGRITEAIAPLAENVLAIDFSERSLELLSQKQLTNVSTFCGDISGGLPLDDHSFNVICACQVIQHMAPEEILRVLAECFRVLKPNGCLLTSVYNFGDRSFNGVVETVENGLYFRRFTPVSLEDLAQKSGFKVAEWHYYRTLPSSWYRRPFVLEGLVPRLDALFAATPYLGIRRGLYIYSVWQKQGAIG